jgi:hypothetical protein
MTYKFVGVLRSLTDDKPYQRTAIWIGVAIGFATEILRKIIKSRAAYKKFVAASRTGFATDFLLDAVVLPSPYASSFGGFVNLPTSTWFAAGGVVASIANSMPRRRTRPPPPRGHEHGFARGRGLSRATLSPRSGWVSRGSSRRYLAESTVQVRFKSSFEQSAPKLHQAR